MGVETMAVLVGAGIRLLDMGIDLLKYSDLTEDEIDKLYEESKSKGLDRDPANLPKPEEM